MPSTVGWQSGVRIGGGVTIGCGVVLGCLARMAHRVMGGRRRDWLVTAGVHRLVAIHCVAPGAHTRRRCRLTLPTRWPTVVKLTCGPGRRRRAPRFIAVRTLAIN